MATRRDWLRWRGELGERLKAGVSCSRPDAAGDPQTHHLTNKKQCEGEGSPWWRSGAENQPGLGSAERGARVRQHRSTSSSDVVIKSKKRRLKDRERGSVAVVRRQRRFEVLALRD